MSNVRTARHATLLAFVCVAACAPALSLTQRQTQLQASLSAIAPDAEPAPPIAPPEDGVPAFNTEYWLGSQEEEVALVKAFGQQIQAIQAKAALDHGGPIARGFHAKSHGCLKGELRLSPTRDARTRFGAFADAYTSWPVVVRYSNGVGWVQADDERDARGMAIKLLGVPGKKYMDDEPLSQDFLMTNSPVPVGQDAIEFMEFARANVRGRLPGVWFLMGHLHTGRALYRTGAIASTVNETYWSGGALHWGAHQTVKVSVAPCAGQAPRDPDRAGPDYLMKDLAAAAKLGVCATFRVQFQADPIETPIENASVIWDEEKYPPLPLGDLVLPPQALLDKAECDALVYHPWHSLAAHKPMGSHNRARLIVYTASQMARGAWASPTSLVPQTPPAPSPAPVLTPATDGQGNVAPPEADAGVTTARDASGD